MKTLSKKSGFSLTELTVTLSISIIVFGMCVPVFFKYATKTKLDASTSEVVSMLKAARNYAITNNKECEVLIPVDATLTAPEDFKYKKIKLIYWDEVDSKYKTVEEWYSLKDGVIFDSRTDSGHSTFLRSPTYVKDKPFPYDDPSSQKKVAVITFKPNGGVQDINGSLCIKLDNNSRGTRIKFLNTTGRINIEDYDPNL